MTLMKSVKEIVSILDMNAAVLKKSAGNSATKKKLKSTNFY